MPTPNAATRPPGAPTNTTSEESFDSGPMTDSDLRGLVVDLVRAMNKQEGASARALNELRGTTEALRDSVDALHRTIDKRDKEVVEVIQGVQGVLERVASQEDRRLDLEQQRLDTEQQRVVAEQEERKRQQDLESQQLALLGKERELEAAASKDWREMVVGVLNSRISGGVASAVSFILVLWFSAWMGLNPADIVQMQTGVLPAFSGLSEPSDDALPAEPFNPSAPTSPVPPAP